MAVVALNRNHKSLCSLPCFGNISNLFYTFSRFPSATATEGSGSRPVRLELGLEAGHRGLKFFDSVHQRCFHPASVSRSDGVGFSNVGVAVVVVVDGVSGRDVQAADRRPHPEAEE